MGEFPNSASRWSPIVPHPTFPRVAGGISTRSTSASITLH